MDEVRIELRLSSEQAARVKAVAEKQDRPVMRLLREAVRDLLEKYGELPPPRPEADADRAA